MQEEKFTVTPWEVKGRIDYEKLIQQFGTQAIDDALLRRLSSIAGEVHPMLRRKIFFSHRDLKWILDRYEKNEKFVLYTGRGPSGHTHLGHLMPWIFTKWLQDRFDVPLYFQMTDDEKFLFKDELSLEEAQKFTYENALDVIALGFDPKKTRILIDTKHIKKLYPIALKVAKRVTFSTAKAVFGFDNSTNIGSIFFTSMQAAPALLPSVEYDKNIPCLIPCAIDQDPHFRIARDVAPLLGFYKPALIHCKMLPSLAGEGKMSASEPESSIFTTDPPKAAQRKIMNAFTGGGVSVEEQRKHGGNPDMCSIFAYYNYLFEYDDKKLSDIENNCRSGFRLCGECKKELADRVFNFLAEHQKKREMAKNRIGQFIEE